jgi:hypothetical protein
MKNLTGIYWIKNEARYIPEYVEFHLLQGFDHFIFYDNKSNDNLLEVISPYIEAGLVEIRYYPPHVTNRNNFWLMEHCVNEQKGKSKWVHFHALDERLYCPDGKLLTDFLKDFEDYDGVCVGWEFFNSNGFNERPVGLITDNYITAMIDQHSHVKTIIQPQYTVSHHGTPHNFIFNQGKFAVDENFRRVNGSFNKEGYSYDKIKLHHYVTMSFEEFNIKMNKGLLDQVGKENVRRETAEAQWDAYHNINVNFFKNDFLKKYSQIIKENLKKRYTGREFLLELINH